MADIFKIFKIDSPYIPLEGEIWGVFCGFNDWYSFINTYAKIDSSVIILWSSGFVMDVRIFRSVGIHEMRGSCVLFVIMELDTLGLRQNGCHFADNILKSIFLNEKSHILLQISHKIVSKCPVGKSSLVYEMIWYPQAKVITWTNVGQYLYVTPDVSLKYMLPKSYHS